MESGLLIKTQRIELSVIMSIYFRTQLKELNRALNSLEDQINIKFDLLIHLDGEVKTEISDFLKEYNPSGAINKIYISKSNRCLGLATSMNILILNNFYKYEFFARHDSDDYSSKERLHIQLNFLKENNFVDIVGSGYATFDSKNYEIGGKSFFPEKNEAIKKAFAYSTPVAHATALFRRSFFTKAGIYQPNHKTLAEDNRLWYSGLYTNCIFANIQKILYFVSLDPKSYKRRSSIPQILVLLKIRLRYILHKKMGISGILRAFIEFSSRIILTILIYLRLNFIVKILVNIYSYYRKF